MKAYEGMGDDFEKRMAEPFEWQNRASIDLLPPDVKPIADEAITRMLGIYGENGALYMHGSSVTGDFAMGTSDIDLIWIGIDNIPENHGEVRANSLSEIDLCDSVGYIDAIAMPVSELLDGDRKAQVFNCAFNGVQVVGKASIDFSGALPETKGDYFSCQFARFGFIVELCREGWGIDSLQKRSPRSLAKSLTRAVFAEAYLRGCLYEQGRSRQHQVLVENGFANEAEEFIYWKQMSSRSMTEPEKQAVFKRAEYFVNVFDNIVAKNPTSYGERVRAWLASVQGRK